MHIVFTYVDCFSTVEILPRSAHWIYIYISWNNPIIDPNSQTYIQHNIKSLILEFFSPIPYNSDVSRIVV